MSDPKITRINRVKSDRTMITADALTPATLTEMLSDALRRSWGNVRGAPKHLARKINANVRTANNLLDGLHAPSSATLIKLMAADDAVFDMVIKITGRDRPPSYEQLQAIKAAVAIMEGKNHP